MNEVDVFIIEHFGTKGMRWGQRKAKTQKSAEDKKSRKKKVIQEVAITAGAAVLAVGSIYVVNLLKQNGAKKMSVARHTKQLAELDQLLNFMGSRTYGSLGR